MTLIMGRPTLDFGRLELAVLAQGATAVFADAVMPALWSAALRYGLDPTGMAAQAGYETAWGKFGRSVTGDWRNTCGLKVRDPGVVLALLPGGQTSEHALCHQMFGTWAAGAEAHAQHLRAYCQVPFDYHTTDPRYRLVLDANFRTGRPPCVHLADLDPWGGTAGYGNRLEQVAARLFAAAGE